MIRLAGIAAVLLLTQSCGLVAPKGLSCSLFSSGGSCSCNVDGTPNDFECSERAVPGTFCCAPANWPNQGECVCEETGVVCTKSLNGPECSCSPGNAPNSFSEKVDRCDAPSGGTCCQRSDPTSAIPDCSCSTARTCDDGEKVASCGTSPTPVCAPGKTHLTSCSS